MNEKTYVIQTMAGKEIYLRDLLNSSDLTADKARFWVPMKNRYWRSNQSELADGAERFQIKKDVLLPGYVLADSDDPFGLYEALRKLQIKTRATLIGMDKDQYVLAVTDKELDWIRALTGEISEVEYVDKKIHFVEGPMVGMDGFVRKVDKRKRMLMVEMPFFQGGEVSIWVAFDEVRLDKDERS